MTDPNITTTITPKIRLVHLPIFPNVMFLNGRRNFGVMSFQALTGSNSSLRQTLRVIHHPGMNAVEITGNVFAT